MLRKPWCPLNIRFDQSAVAVDLFKIDHREWAPQAEASVDQTIRPFQGEDWSVIPLLSPNSDSNRTDPGLPGEDYGPTPVLSKLDAFESLLDSIPCEKMAARLFRLKPGASIERHTDPFLVLNMVSYGFMHQLLLLNLR